MTQMAGTNPKIAALFGGNGLGMDYGKMNNHAFEMQSDLQNSATMADARANIAGQEADYIRDSAEYKANAMGAQSSAAGNANMVGLAGSALTGAAGLFGGGGGLTTPSAGALTTARNDMKDFYRSGGY